MTGDEAALLQAVLADPDAAAPRLAYADWYERHGQPERAEFIRLQLELARFQPAGSLLVDLRARQADLLAAHAVAWAGRLRGCVNCQFRRGFVEAVTTRPEQFLEHADEVVRAAPIREVRFQTAVLRLARPHLVAVPVAPLVPRLAACPQLDRLAALDFWANYLGDEGLTALTLSPYLADLARLGLRQNDVGDAGVRALAASTAFVGLTVLDLGQNRITPGGVRALAGSAHLGRLESLDLSHNPVADAGAEALAASPHLAGLTTLGLAGAGLTTAGARALAESPHLAGLRSLDVRDNRIGNKARQALRQRLGKGDCRFA